MNPWLTHVIELVELDGSWSTEGAWSAPDPGLACKVAIGQELHLIRTALEELLLAVERGAEQL